VHYGSQTRRACRGLPAVLPVSPPCLGTSHGVHVEQTCTADIEPLAVGRTICLGKFSHVFVIAAYVPPSANAEAACDVIHSATSRRLTQHPKALLLLSGDFNHAPPSSTLPAFTQYVTPETIRHRISSMPTPRRHIRHHLFLPWADLTTTWCTPPGDKGPPQEEQGL